VKQTLQEIEIILVDDGSTDKSLAILKEYVAKDSRITIIAQENKGGSAARNTGLQIAIGEYLSFLDSDDFFDETMLEKMYKKAKELDADITICRTTVIDAASGATLNSPNDWMYKKAPQKEVFTMEDNIDGDFMLGIGSAWDKLFRKSFIDEHGLKFQVIRNIDDVYFVSASLYRAKSITILGERLYTYRVNREDQLSRDISSDPLVPYEAWSAVKDDLQKLNILEKVERQFLNYALRHYLWYCFGAVKNVKAFQIFYHALQEYILPEMDLESRPADYFYGETKGGLEEAKKIVSTPFDEYLFYKWRQAGGYTQEQQAYIQKQQTHIEMQNGQLQELKTALSGKDGYIQKQQAHIEMQNSQLQKLESLLDLHRNFAKKQVEYIEWQNLEIENLNVQYINIINSRSWKLTKPIRKLKSIIVRVTGGVKRNK
jgi:glycosyltransferase involved in cell wall biosynthesis